METCEVLPLVLNTWAIQTRGLSWCRPGGLAVLQDVNLRVPYGAVVGVVGRNGAGKSSLMRCLAGLASPTSGECLVQGEPVAQMSDAARSLVGYAAQSPVLFEDAGALEHLRRFSELYPGYDMCYAWELARRLDVPLDKLVSAMSVGDRQKLNVVLALGHDPDIVLLDEPVASLDPSARRDFLRTLFDRRTEALGARTVVMSSHLLSDLERVVSHVVFMRGGRLQAFDEWDALTENLRLLVASDLDGAVPEPSSVVNRSVRDGVSRWVVDLRRSTRKWPTAQALGLDDLFEELNA